MATASNGSNRLVISKPNYKRPWNYGAYAAGVPPTPADFTPRFVNDGSLASVVTWTALPSSADMRNEGGSDGDDAVARPSDEEVEQGSVVLFSSWVSELEKAFTSRTPGEMDLKVLPEITDFLALISFSEKYVRSKIAVYSFLFPRLCNELELRTRR
jgi:hypothetical protein